MTTKSTPSVKKPLKPSAAPKLKRWVPHAYQRKAVKFLLDHGAAALFLDPGLGKTSVTLAALKMLFKDRASIGALVVAPLRPATMTWPDELSDWADFADLDAVVLHGPKFSPRCREEHQIYIINYEGLAKLFTRRKVGKVWKYELTPDGKAIMEQVDTLVWDELSKMKNPGTLRYTLIKPWIKKFTRRWGLTGSPASNGLMDLFGQCFVLDEGNALGPFITHYRSEYFLPLDDMGYSWRLKDGADLRIYKRLSKLALRMDAEDYLKMPQQLSIPIKLELPPAVRKQYDELEKELLTTIGDDLIVAANAAAANSKCRQVCSGALYLPNVDPITGVARTGKAGRTWALLHDEKINALKDLVEELQGHQLFVAYEFNHDLERLLKAFPNTPYIGGGVTVARARELEALWNSGALPLMFGHPASVGHGLNFQKSNAHHIAHFTLTWDFELYDQFNRRLRRQGNTASKLFVYHFMVKDSVEESVAYALVRKNKTQRALLDALKSRKRWEDE